MIIKIVQITQNRLRLIIINKIKIIITISHNLIRKYINNNNSNIHF